MQMTDAARDFLDRPDVPAQVRTHLEGIPTDEQDAAVEKFREYERDGGFNGTEHIPRTWIDKLYDLPKPYKER
jgi:hypothetical protein